MQYAAHTMCYNTSSPMKTPQKKLTAFLLKQYAQMSGDKKIRIAMKLSAAVRAVRKAGIAVTGA